MWQSLVLVFLAFIPFEEQGGSLWLEGNFVYLGIVIIVNINVLTATNNHSWISLLFQVGSIAVAMLVALILNYLKFSVLFGTAPQQYSSLEFYYVLLLMALAIVQVDIGINYVNRKIRERMIKIARSIRKKIKNFRTKKMTDDNLAEKTEHRYIHRGFAFDQEPGNAPQVVDKVKNISLRRKSVRYSVKTKIEPTERKGMNSKTIFHTTTHANSKKKLTIDDIFEENENSNDEL